MSSAHLTEYVTIQKPGKSPVLKGPFRPTHIEAFLREAISAYPDATVNVISVHGSASIDVESGQECLAVFDAVADSRKNSRTVAVTGNKSMGGQEIHPAALRPSKL